MPVPDQRGQAGRGAASVPRSARTARAPASSGMNMSITDTSKFSDANWSTASRGPICQCRDHAAQEVDRVPVLDHHALGLPGGPRRVDHVGRVVRGGPGQPAGPSSRGSSTAPSWSRRTAVTGACGSRAALAWSVTNDGHRRVGDHVGQPVGWQGRVQRDVAAARLPDAQQRGQPVAARSPCTPRPAPRGPRRAAAAAGRSGWPAGSARRTDHCWSPNSAATASGVAAAWASNAWCTQPPGSGAAVSFHSVSSRRSSASVSTGRAEIRADGSATAPRSSTSKLASSRAHRGRVEQRRLVRALQPQPVGARLGLQGRGRTWPSRCRQSGR